MRTVVIALGSAGDVHPFLAIGLALQKRGHHVAFLTNSYFESIVRRAGLDFYSVGSVTDYERATQDPNLWDPRRGLAGC
jgi:rhamnosyltransferase subunit B